MSDERLFKSLIILVLALVTLHILIPILGTCSMLENGTEECIWGPLRRIK